MIKMSSFPFHILQVVYVLITPKPLIINSKEGTLDGIRKHQKWENDNKICHGHIFNAISDGLFDVYHTITIAKELWDQLEAKYMREDATSKMFLNNYKIVDNKPVTE